MVIMEYRHGCLLPPFSKNHKQKTTFPYALCHVGTNSEGSISFVTFEGDR
jgi:hypothetical protein